MPVLLLEDKPDLRDMVRPVLESMNLRVIEPADGVTALSLFRAYNPYLVITGITNPGGDGVETLREMRRIDPRVKIIALSRGDNGKHPDPAGSEHNLEAEETLRTPFHAEELRAAVSRQVADVVAPPNREAIRAPGVTPLPQPAERDQTIHILIVDDHALFADAVEHLLASLGPSVRISKASSMLQALAIAEAAADLSLAIVDLRMPEMDGLDGLRRLRQRRPDLKITIMSGDASAETVRSAIEAGANGFIPKTMTGPAIFHALRLVLAGERYIPAGFAGMDRPAGGSADDAVALTVQESSVLEELATGKSNKDIGRALGVSVSTVTFHLTNLYHKLGVTGRMQAVRRAFELGLLDERRG